MTLIYKKTNALDGQCVFKSFELIDIWFSCLKTSLKQVPSNFDFYGLMKGIFIVLESDDAISVAKAIWIVYRNFGL